MRLNNYLLIVCNTDETLEKEEKYLDLMLRHRVDGIIAAATSQNWDLLSTVEKELTPIVFVDRKFEGLAGRARRIGQEAAQILLKMINGTEISQKELILSFEFVIRESC